MPALWGFLRPVWVGWQIFGWPVRVASGLMESISPASAELYPARLLWLDENGITARAMYLHCWDVLDTEALAITREQQERRNSEDGPPA